MTTILVKKDEREKFFNKFGNLTGLLKKFQNGCLTFESIDGKVKFEVYLKHFPDFLIDKDIPIMLHLFKEHNVILYVNNIKHIV